MTRAGKPFLEIGFADATGEIVVKAWNNHPQFQLIESLPRKTFVRVEGQWTSSSFGIDAKNWELVVLDADEVERFLGGDPQLAAKQGEDWDWIVAAVDSFADPRLKAVARLFLNDYGNRFRRAAAARKNHHARRGGLVEHTAQMMRCARAICGVYPTLNEDLLLAGTLFHDCGKMWETCYPEKGFSQTVDLRGELLGHISIGLELVNKLWREAMDTMSLAEQQDDDVPAEHVRLHLLHLIGSHHGTYEFGSPVLPRTPEAHALHHIDNFDAKFEMLSETYATGVEAAPGIFEKQWPLPAGAVQPLPKQAFQANSPEGIEDSDIDSEDIDQEPISDFLF